MPAVFIFGWYLAHVQSLWEVLVFLSVDLDEFQATSGLRRDALQHGAERAARAAPGRPEIHQNGDCVAPLNDLPFEILNFVAHLWLQILQNDYYKGFGYWARDGFQRLTWFSGSKVASNFRDWAWPSTKL